MIYPICTSLFLIGLLGLLAQVLLGAGHAGHGGHAGHAGHAGHGGHGHHAATPGAKGRGQGGSGFEVLLGLLSPLMIFSVCLGAGATGLLLRHLHPSTPIVAISAAVGGLGFYGLIIRNLWNLIFRFASTPSRALDGMVAGEAEAVSHFNESGQGMVNLVIDGQIVRILATLEVSDREGASEIAPGDHLTVTSIDGHSNTCRVARL